MSYFRQFTLVLHNLPTGVPVSSVSASQLNLVIVRQCISEQTIFSLTVIFEDN